MSVKNYSVKFNFGFFFPYRYWKLIPNRQLALTEMESEFDRLSDYFVNRSMIKLFPDDSFGVNLFSSYTVDLIESLKEESSVEDVVPIPYQEHEVCFFKPSDANTICGLLSHLCGSIGLPARSLVFKELKNVSLGSLVIVKCSVGVYKILHRASK